MYRFVLKQESKLVAVACGGVLFTKDATPSKEPNVDAMVPAIIVAIQQFAVRERDNDVPSLIAVADKTGGDTLLSDHLSVIEV